MGFAMASRAWCGGLHRHVIRSRDREGNGSPALSASLIQPKAKANEREESPKLRFHGVVAFHLRGSPEPGHPVGTRERRDTTSQGRALPTAPAAERHDAIAKSAGARIALVHTGE